MRHFNRWVASLLLLPVLCLAGTSYAAPQELVFLTWSDYMDPELVSEFEEQFNTEVRFVYFESDETRTDLLIKTDGKGYDLLLVNEYALEHYLRRGWIAPLNKQRIANLEHMHQRWLEQYPEYQDYAVPYFWGTIGIAYRRDLVKEPITSWQQFFNPSEAQRGKIIMIKNMNDTLGTALKALGYSFNSNEPDALAEAEALLQNQKPYVKTYSYVALGEDSSLVSGDTHATMIYNGDALMVQEHSDDIVYVAPKEGTALWIDYMAIAASSNKKDLAADFINFMNEPEHAARQADYVYYATPNKAAEAFLPEEYFQNPVIYPPDEVLEKSEFYIQHPPRALRKRNQIFNRLLQ